MTIEEAKCLYIKYDCSLFAMAREEKSKYEKYKSLEISNEVEEKWKQEQFLFLYKQIKITGDSTLFNKMYNLSGKSKNKENIVIMEKALKYIKYDTLDIKVSVAETILGRKDISVRSGLVFEAYDLKEYDLARKFLVFANKILTDETSSNDITSRVKRAIQTCNLIDKELKLEMYDII